MDQMVDAINDHLKENAGAKIIRLNVTGNGNFLSYVLELEPQ